MMEKMEKNDPRKRQNSISEKMSRKTKIKLMKFP